MAVTHTPLGLTVERGAQLHASLVTVEAHIAKTVQEIASVMEAIDGGEGNATDATKVASVTSRWMAPGASAADTVAMIGQLQAIRAIFLNGANKAALDQAFNRLR